MTKVSDNLAETVPASGATGWDASFANNAFEKLAAATPVGVKANGVPATGSAADTAMNALYTKLAALPGYFKLMFEDGTYALGDTIPPANILGFEPVNEHSASLVRTATSPTTWIVPRASGFVLQGLTIDAKKSLVTLPNVNMDGFVAVLFQKPTSLSGGGVSIAGGIPLSAAPSAGATSIAVTRAYSGPSAAAGSPIVPGDVLNICGGGVYDRVRVHESYTIGNLTIPLEGQLLHGFTTGANVSHAQTGCVAQGNIIYGSGIQHAVAHGGSVSGNKMVNQIDYSLGTFDRGCYGIEWSGNEVETYSYWGLVVDDFALNDNTYPPNDLLRVVNNAMRFLKGGPDIGTGPGAGNLDLIAITGALRTLVAGNTLDIKGATSGGGASAVRINPNGKHTRVIGNSIVGDGTVNSFGVKVVTVGTVDANCDPEIRDNHIEGVYDGIELGQCTSANVTNNKLRNIGRINIGQTYSRSDAAVALHRIDGNDMDSGAYGVYLNSGATVPAGSGYSGENLVRAGVTTPTVLASNFAHPPTGLREMDPWIPLAALFVNSWANEGVSYRNPGYRLNAAGQVEFMGAMKSGSTATVAFTLPVGYRPAAVVTLTTGSAGGVAQLTIATTGAVTVTQVSGTVATRVDLDGLTFPIT